MIINGHLYQLEHDLEMMNFPAKASNYQRAKLRLCMYISTVKIVMGQQSGMYLKGRQRAGHCWMVESTSKAGITKATRLNMHVG